MKPISNAAVQPANQRTARGLAGAVLGFLALSFASVAHGQTPPAYYDLQVLNNFAAGEYFGVTPQSSNIWLLTNFQFDYKSGGSYVTGSSSSGSWTPVQLSAITDGKIRIYTAGSSGSRMYAVLGPTAPPSQQPTTTAPVELISP